MQALRRELADLAVRDPLTGLPNRRHFEELLREELVRTRVERAADVVERLRSMVEAHAFEGEEMQPSGHITISVGLAECGSETVQFEECIRRADEASYLAKAAGRNCVRIAGRS